MDPSQSDLEVPLKSDPVRAIVEGKTAVSFQSLVGLVLQRKVLSLFKQWGKEPIIISSELLTAIAGTPQDNADNRQKLVLVTLTIGVVVGVFATCVVGLGLVLLRVPLGVREFGIVAGSIAAVSLVGWLGMKVQGKSSAEQVTETMEKVANFLK
ncbi:MAG: hypothetical protein KBC95_01920 [Candidatus Peribacteraceae bacterium]|nr:hypothetical protein [Candidatus Peribacteraceae bacterium]